jgi:hypothetical protein
MKYDDARVSTDDQKADLQIAALQESRVERILNRQDDLFSCKTARNSGVLSHFTMGLV